MSSNGSGAQERSRIKARLVYRLSKDGFTNRQIAETVGCDVKAVPGYRKVGERLADEGDGTHPNQMGPWT